MQTRRAAPAAFLFLVLMSLPSGGTFCHGGEASFLATLKQTLVRANFIGSADFLAPLDLRVERGACERGLAPRSQGETTTLPRRGGA